MSIVELMRRMRELGAPPEAIELAVEAIEAEQKKDAERRAKRAAQKAKERATKAPLGGDSRATVARQGGDSRNDLPPNGSPKDITQTPSLPPICSDPDGSDGASAPSPAALPIVDQVWLKVADLSDLSGRKQEAVRSWIGKALKDHSPETVLKGIAEAIKAKSGDPFAYAKRVMMGGSDPPRRSSPEPKKPSVQDAARELLDQFRNGADRNDRVLALPS